MTTMTDIIIGRHSDTLALVEGLTDAGADFVDDFVIDGMLFNDSGSILIPTTSIPDLIICAKADKLEIGIFE
jgi:hypothetical protein